MKYGFIGCGNMGSALARACAKAVGGKELALANRTRSKAETLAKELGTSVAGNEEIADTCDYIFLGVKPQMMAGLLAELQPVLQKRAKSFTLVTMAAGLTIEKINVLAGGDYPVIRIMPNTPASIGEGVILCCANSQASTAQLEKDFRFAGSFVQLPENLMDAGSAVSGCGPAFVYLFIEALADGGVACGLPRSTALTLAAQTVAGSAGMVKSTGKHPGELKDAVCSPAGSTIEGVRALEEHQFRAAAISAVKAAFDRTKELGK